MEPEECMHHYRQAYILNKQPTKTQI